MYMIEAITGNDRYEVYDDRYTDERWSAFDASFSLEDNAAGSLSFTIPPTNNAYGLKPNGEQKLQRMVSDIYVRKYNRQTGKNPIVWGGRIVSDDYDFYNNRTITCEGSFAFFNDTVHLAGNLQNVPLCAMLDIIINQEHSGMSTTDLLIPASRGYPKMLDSRKIFLRVNKTDSQGNLLPVDDWTSPDISVIDLWGTLTGRSPKFSWDNQSVMSTLEMFLEYYGGHMWIEYAEENGKIVRYFHWDSSDSLPTCTQPIVFGENLVSYASNYDSTNFATVIVPQGCGLEDGDIPPVGQDTRRNQSAKNLTIDFSNSTAPLLDPTDPNVSPYAPYMVPATDGMSGKSPYSVYVAMVKLDANGDPVSPTEYLYETNGWRAVVQTWSDITDTLVLLAKAVSYLKNLQFDELTIDVSAADLVDLGVQTAIDAGEDSFKFLSLVHVLSIPHGLDADFLITKITIDMDEPGNNSISLTHKDKTHRPMSLTELVSSENKRVNSALSNEPKNVTGGS